jgi:hypothetical protein
MTAEVKYLLQIGITPPACWWDTMLGFRYWSNGEHVQPFKLVKALLALGLPYGRSAEEKDALQKHIGCLNINPDSPDERRLIRSYCLDDCEATLRIYQRLAPSVPDVWMRFAASYCLATARSETYGLAIDMDRYSGVVERKEEVVERVTAVVNDLHPVFVNGQLSRGRFLSWCSKNGIGWPCPLSPRTGAKSYCLDRKTFERMKDRHPFIRAVHEANKTSKQLLNRSLVVDPVTGRHHYRNIPFGMATGRTSFAGSLLSCPKWMRWLIVPTSPEHALVVVDFDAEEILIAAHLSGDANILDGYRSTDPHMSFAIRAGAAPPGATKATHAAVRQQYKSVNLGVNYGQTAYGMSESTGLNYREADRLLRQHRRGFAAFWAWTDRYVTDAFRRGVCRTVAGWPRWVTRTDNPRSVANFPVQGAGGDLMRLATIYLDRQGLRLLATNHDSFLLECLREELPQLRQAVDFALHRAVNQLLPGAPMRWSVDVFNDRYRDEAGASLWRLVTSVLNETKQRRVTVSN